LTANPVLLATSTCGAVAPMTLAVAGLTPVNGVVP
jgi:hypothetical protein